MNRITGKAEEFLWNSFKRYLLTYQTCLLDLILQVQDENTERPIDRYKDLMNDLGRHMGLGSYVNTQPTQFTEVPYITVNIAPIPMGHCSTRVVMSFDVVYATDVPKAPNDNSTRYVGSSSESVAWFRARVVDALCQLFYRAFGDGDDTGYEEQPFWKALCGQNIPKPTEPDIVEPWEYNIVGQVDSDYTISEVTQLKREDRSSGLSVFTVTFTMDINRLFNSDFDCGC